MALFPPKMATVTPPAIILWIFLVSASTFLPVNAASNFSLDDIVLIEETKLGVQQKLELWRDTLEARGFRLSRSKTEYMECRFSDNSDREAGMITFDGKVVHGSTFFRYLGSIIQKYGELDGDVAHRIKAGWLKWKSATGVLCDPGMPHRLKGKFYRTAIRPGLLYGTECWAVKQCHVQKMNVAEMRMLRWMCGHTKKDRLRNEVIREKTFVSGPTMLQLSPSLIVESSPGLKPGAKVKCERVIVHGLPRVKHLSKFANSVKVKVSCLDPSGRPPNIDVCFHRNVSLGVGMCPQAQWERLTKGLWMKAMSPFDHKILDIRVGVSCSQSIEVSLDEAIIPSFGSSVDECGFLAQQVFRFLLQYCDGYGDLSCDINGTFPVGMKLLPTGRKSSLGIFLYSCFIGLGSFLLRYVPRLLRALLVEIGLSEDLYDPVLLAMLLLVFLVISGAWLGFWVVRKLVLAEDGSIDIGVSYFVTWSIRIVASVMILQSSVDPLLAVEALVGGIVLSSWNPKVVYRVCKKLCRLNKISLRELLDPYSRLVKDPSISTPYTKAPYMTRVRGSTLTSDSLKRLSDTKTFYSTFHETPDRKKFTKDEWESFTRESTRKALEGLVSSPDFSRWAVAHADRITLAPKKEISDKRRRWFHWF
ncbi:hypothetical protein OROHE_002534 [Orobanche hederae]